MWDDVLYTCRNQRLFCNDACVDEWVSASGHERGYTMDTTVLWKLASAPSRCHDPELSEVLDGWGEASPFDAENAAELVGQVFTEFEVHWWEVPAFHLADRAAVVDYLDAFKQPAPEARAELVRTPVTVTKSGCDVWATAG